MLARVLAVGLLASLCGLPTSARAEPVEPAPSSDGRRLFGVGFNLAAGTHVLPRGFAPTAEGFGLELQFFPTLDVESVDVHIDWLLLVLSEQLSDWPSLGVAVFYHRRVPPQSVAALGLAVGFDAVVGPRLDVIDDVLVHRPALAFGLAGRVGLELRTPDRIYTYGVYLRGAIGPRLAYDDHLLYARILGELTFTFHHRSPGSTAGGGA